MLMRMNAQDYFPLKVGNSWTYCSSQDTTYKRTYLIKDTVNIVGKKCFLYGRQDDMVNDTLWKDINGNVWKLKSGILVLWLDFTKDSGAVYYYPAFNSEVFTVTVRKYLSIDTYVKTFDNCIELLFDIPAVIDDEVIYIFAPDIGLIKKRGAWSDDLLYSAYINDVPVSIADDLENIPTQLSLSQNFPNPFNPITSIRYVVNHSSEVKIIVYDMLGRVVREILNEYKPVGTYEIKFDGTQYSSGIYYYRLVNNKVSITKKFVLIK